MKKFYENSTTPNHLRHFFLKNFTFMLFNSEHTKEKANNDPTGDFSLWTFKKFIQKIMILYSIFLHFVAYFTLNVSEFFPLQPKSLIQKVKWGGSLCSLSAKHNNAVWLLLFF